MKSYYLGAVGLWWVCVCTCLWTEFKNSYESFTTGNSPMPPCGRKVFRLWDRVVALYVTPYVGLKNDVARNFEVVPVSGSNFTEIRTHLKVRADRIRLRFTERALKWFVPYTEAMERAAIEHLITHLAGDDYYVLDDALAVEVEEVKRYLAFKTNGLHEQYVAAFGSMTRGRREESQMTAELMTSTGVLLIKFGSVVKGLVHLEHLRREGAAKLQSDIMATIQRDKGYIYINERISKRMKQNWG